MRKSTHLGQLKNNVTVQDFGLNPDYMYRHSMSYQLYVGVLNLFR